MTKLRDYEYWDTIDEIGDLFIEIVLVYGNEPVLFVCLDEYENRYLFMTYNSNELKYVFVKTNEEALLNMLLNECSIEQTFRKAGEIYYSHEDQGANLVYDTYDAMEFDAEKLPEVDMMFELDFPFIQAYIKRLKDEKEQKQKNIHHVHYRITYNRSVKSEFYMGYRVGCERSLGSNESNILATSQKKELTVSVNESTQNRICISEHTNMVA